MSRRLLAALFLLFIVGSLSFASVKQPAQAAPMLQAPPPRTVFVHLFEWRWADVARECETYLGPKGFSAVQVSPPHEHLNISAAGYPWWQRYQVVSYNINSRSGDRNAFSNMVQRCNAVGVDIYVDAIINHMSGYEGAPAYGGSSWTHYNYPGTYSSADFHYCGTNGNEITNYGDRWNVQNCELSNLADLKTESTYVRNRIRQYLQDLLSLGVDGFRIDAAKHIPSGDLQAILGGLTKTDGTAPYVFQEVIESSTEPIQAGEYFGTGDVTEFDFGKEVARVFFSGNLSELYYFTETKPGFMGSQYSVAFIDNHDKQRGHGGGGTYVTYKNGATYALANVWMLAWPYGYPALMSSYDFTNTEAGPPGTNGVTKVVYDNATDTTPDCNGAGNWVCEHRWTAIGNMVAFRNYTARNFYITDWWTNNYDAVAFGRGNAGYVIVNGESFAINRTWQTSMPAGTYCNVTDGQKNAAGTGCTGTSIVVNSSGQFTANVNAMSSIAIHDGQKVTTSSNSNVTFRVNATTVSGQNVYVVGNIAALGNWNACSGVKLDPTAYPTWSKTISLPASTAIQFKFVKWQGTCTNIIWESAINNRTLTTPAGGGSMTTTLYNWNTP